MECTSRVDPESQLDDEKPGFNILCVDDEMEFLIMVREYMERYWSNNVHIVDSGEGALEMLQSMDFDIIISDYQMPRMNGIQLLKETRRMGCTTPFILLTGRGAEELAIEALREGVDSYKAKGGVPKILYSDLQNQIEILVGKRHAERELEESRKLYKSLFDNTGTAMIVLDSNYDIIKVNREFERLTGYEREEVVGKIKGTELISSKDLNTVTDYYLQERSDPDSVPQRYEFSLVDKNGDQKEVSISVGMIPGTDQRVNSLIDITDLRAAEKALAKANKNLNILSKITRHDINNHLSVVSGYIELMEEELSSSPKLVHQMEMIKRNMQNVQDLINFTKEYESLGITPPTWQNVKEVALGAMDSISGGLSLNVTTERLEIYANPLLGRVFHNLFNNSIMHGNASKVEISFHEIDDRGKLVVEDDGGGVPTEFKEKIFKEGYGRRNGLGLFLVREILDTTSMVICENGGLGKGARFEITIPKKNYAFE